MNNKYVNRSKITETKFRKLVRYFSLDLTATQITQLTGLNRNTVNRYLTEIRKKIASHIDRTRPFNLIDGFDQSDSGTGNYIVLLRVVEKQIHTTVISVPPDKKWNELIQDLTNQEHHFDIAIHPKSGHQDVINSDRAVINDQIRRQIGSFWGTVRSRLSKFKGMHTSTYIYHLKECEFRFNHRQKNLYSLILQILRNDPLF